MKKLLSVVIACSLMLATFAGCTSEPKEENPGGEQGQTEGAEGTGGATLVDGDTLTVAQGADAKTLDPQGSNDQPSSRITKQIYDTLFVQDENMVVHPGLAETYEIVEEGTVLNIKLREGVKFHNGEILTANDVKFTILRALDSPDVAHIVGPVTSVEVIDDLNLVITMEYAFAPILSHLSHTAISILNEKAVLEAEATGSYGQNPIGTGPYKFVSWTIGDNVKLTRNDEYYDTAAIVPNLVFRSIPEDSSRLLELEAGGVDIVYDIAPSDIERAETTEGMELVRSSNFSNSYIGFNTKKAPFDNVKVRQAINLALDMETIVEAVYYGSGQPAKGPMGEKVWAYNTELKGYGYDVEAAKALLAEAGFQDGFTTTIWTNENPQRMQIAEIVQNQLGQIGITATVETVEWATYLDGTAAGEHDMFILGWVAVTGDPDYALYANFHSEAQGAAGNRTFYSNPTVDALLDEARVSADPAVREAAYKEVQQIIFDEAPWIFVQEGEDLTAIGSDVEGFVNNPAGHHVLKTVSFAK